MFPICILCLYVERPLVHVSCIYILQSKKLFQLGSRGCFCQTMNPITSTYTHLVKVLPPTQNTHTLNRTFITIKFNSLFYRYDDLCTKQLRYFGIVKCTR